MSGKAKKEYGTSYRCETCEMEKFVEHDEFIVHMEAVHGLKVPIKHSSSLSMHLDGQDWYSSSYNCVTSEKEVRFVKVSCFSRIKAPAS